MAIARSNLAGVASSTATTWLLAMLAAAAPTSNAMPWELHSSMGHQEPSCADWDTCLSAQHRNPSQLRNESFDERLRIMAKHAFKPCPAGGRLIHVSGEDERYHDKKGERRWYDHSERNAKVICNADRLRAPCVVYSMGSHDEISFEVGLHELGRRCDVHVFDPFSLPPKRSRERYNLTTHATLIGSVNDPSVKPPHRTMASIMDELSHSFVDVLKIDIEGAERLVWPHMVNRNLFQKVGVVAAEFHTEVLLAEGMEIMRRQGFAPAFGRPEHRCDVCTEVMFFNTRLGDGYWQGIEGLR